MISCSADNPGGAEAEKCKAEEFYADGSIRVVRECHDNGKVSKLTEYSGIGKSTTDNPDRFKAENPKKDPISVDPVNGYKSLETTYNEEGVRTGSVTFYADGKVQKTTTYTSDGVNEGEVTSTNRDGKNTVTMNLYRSDGKLRKRIRTGPEEGVKRTSYYDENGNECGLRDSDGREISPRINDGTTKCVAADAE